MKQDKELQVTRTAHRVELTPPVDIYDEDDKVILMADMPGVNPETLDVRYERGQLTIQGRQEAPSDMGPPVLGEFELGDYHRTFTIGEEIDPAKITAEIKNGVLRIDLLKVEARKPQKILVKAK